MNKKIKTLSGTIAALASAKGRSGIAVIRVSGPKAIEIYNKITNKQPKHLKATYTSLFDSSGLEIDKGVCLFFSGPKSYTGEDVFEITCHGSTVIVEMLLGRLFELGARQALEGEFTKRAYLNDKMDLTQAEAVADLIESVSTRTAKAALKSLSGDFSQRVNQISKKIIKLRSIIEASLDFSDQDLEETDHPKLVIKEVEMTKNSYLVLIKQTRIATRLRDGLVVAIVGEPNVGKSTLFNRMCGSERAIVSSKAGTTRDIISENITIDGFPIQIIDTAGIRESKEEVEQEGVRRAIEASKTADLAIEVIDIHKHKKKEELEGTITALNKIDTYSGPTIKCSENTFLVSAKTGTGIDKLLDFIASYFIDADDGATAITARKRHIVSLRESFQAFSLAEKGINEGAPLDLVAEDLLQAQNSLAEVTGEFCTEDLLESIFNNFCIGK